MQIAIIGLGRMGKGLAGRLLEAGHEVVVWNRTPDVAQELESAGATAVASVEEVVKALSPPRVVWVMLPSVNKEDPDAPTVTDGMLKKLTGLLDKEDILIDGGNSRWTKSQEHASWCEEEGIRFLDIGTSGGVLGPRMGYAMMAGGDESAWNHIKPMVDAMTPEGGGGYFGPAGAGHYVKMVHNSIEYGMMQAVAEGMNLLKNNKDYAALDMASATQVWSSASIIRSLLVRLLNEAMRESPSLKKVAPIVEETGEGQWAAEAALEKKIPYSVNTAALFERRASMERNEFANKVLSVLRTKFGGHVPPEK